jgi:hypothetical protein
VAIEKLQSTEELTSEGASDGTMITVCKYDSYQEIPTPKGKPKGEQRANKGQATGQTKGNKQEEEEGLEEEQEQVKKGVTAPPPLVEDVIAYFKENGYTEASARKAFDYYEASVTETKRHWSDGKGTPIKNWKMKMQSVWFKDEHKIEQPKIIHRPVYSGPIL